MRTFTPPSPRPRSPLAVSAALLALTVGAVFTACARSSAPGAKGHPSAPHGQAASPSAAGGSGPGIFGDLGRICEPANPGRARSTTARGLTPDTIRLGTIGDPGAAARPGSSRSTSTSPRPSPSGATPPAASTAARSSSTTTTPSSSTAPADHLRPASKEFMLVGGGNAFDAVDVKPRLACKLAQIPALDVSPQAGLRRAAGAAHQQLPHALRRRRAAPAGRRLSRRQARARDRQQQRRLAEPAGPLRQAGVGIARATR